MELKQNDRERIVEMARSGAMTADQANVEKVRAQRVQLVTSRIPAQVRAALNEAVKRGELGHIKKDGHKPECYFHPSFDYMVPAERNAHAQRIALSVASVCC